MLSAEATHLIGGYMSYQYLGRNANGDYDYKVTLNIFRDKLQSTVDFDDEIELGIHLNNNTLQLYRPWPINIIFKRRVEPPGSEDCEFYADNVNIEQGFYEAVISLPPNSAGYHLTFVRCCRNIQDNLTTQSGQPFQGQTYYCFIPNPIVENSSPFFSGVPSPYMCAKDTNVFLNRAVDPDGDSLVYRFVWPHQGGAPTQGGAMPPPPDNLSLPLDSVEYLSGYGYKRPFGPGTYIDIDRSNGLTTLYAPRPGSYVVAIEVWEYRDGKLLSKVRLDLQILVLDCPPNKQPKVQIPSGYYHEVEAGEEICFDVEGFDIDDDNVKIFGDGDIFTGDNKFEPPLAVLKSNTSQGTVRSEFCWTPSCEQARKDPYEFTVIVEDDGCPPKNDKKNVEILVKKFIGSDDILGPISVCAGSGELYTYTAANAGVNSKFFWQISNGIISGPSDGVSVDVDWNGSSSSGTLRMLEISEFGCPGDTVNLDVSLLASPPPPVISGPDTVCLLSSGNRYTVPNNTGSTYEWLAFGGTIERNNGSNVDVRWDILGDQKVGAIEKGSNGCLSDTFFFDVNVRNPLPKIVGPVSVCPNAAGVAYTATKEFGSVYSWTVTGGVKSAGGTLNRILVDWGNIGTGVVRVVQTDKFGCISVPVSINVEKEYDLDGQIPIGDDRVCDNESVVDYFVIESSGSVYNWDIINGNQLNGDSSSQIQVNWPSSGSGRVGVREKAYDAVNNRFCFSSYRYLDVQIFPSPTANTLVGDFEVCEGPDSVSYSLNGFAGSSYYWRVDGDDAKISGQGKSSIKLAWPNDGIYKIEVIETTKDSCLGAVIDSNVIVHPNPETKGIFGDAVLCYPDNNAKAYSVTGFANSTYEWVVQNGIATPSSSDNVSIDWPTDGTGLIRVLETSEFGCHSDTLELPIYISRLELDLRVISVGFPDNRINGSYFTVYDDLKNGKFQIQRRPSNSGAAWMTVADESFTNFLELDLNTDDNAWEYRIRAVDLCGNERFS